jgi:hypothetical protein
MVGTSSALSAQLTNAGLSTVTISSASISGAGYSLSGLSFPMRLGPGNSAQFQVIFALLAAHVDGNIGFTNSASSSTLYLSVHGTGANTGMLSVSPSSVNFGTTVSGNSVTQLEALTNTGSANVTLQQISSSGLGLA